MNLNLFWFLLSKRNLPKMMKEATPSVSISLGDEEKKKCKEEWIWQVFFTPQSVHMREMDGKRPNDDRFNPDVMIPSDSFYSPLHLSSVSCGARRPINCSAVQPARTRRRSSCSRLAHMNDNRARGKKRTKNRISDIQAGPGVCAGTVRNTHVYNAQQKNKNQACREHNITTSLI